MGLLRFSKSLSRDAVALNRIQGKKLIFFCSKVDFAKFRGKGVNTGLDSIKLRSKDFDGTG